MDRRRSSTSPIRALGLLVFFGVAGGGCKSAGAPSGAPGVTLASIALTSGSFPARGAIPVDYTCDGADRSPELTWSEPPAGTRSFAIFCEDPDAPSGTFTHWVAYDLPGALRSLPEGTDPSAAGGADGTNDFDRTGYAGPCPPKGQLHHYSFRVFALDARIGTQANPTRGAVTSAMNGHVLAEGALVGIYSR